MADEVRLIDANALHKEITSFDHSVIYKDWVQSAIASAPTISDVVPVVHGVPVRKNRPKKYEWYEEVKTENGEILYRKHVYVDETNWAEYCPACGKRICSRFKSYCPSCGAIMDLKDKQT